MIKLIVSVALFTSAVLAVCPPEEVLIPCKCTDDKIVCDGDHDLDLYRMFGEMSKDNSIQRTFVKFNLVNNNKITELKKDTFRDFQFSRIHIRDCNNLTTIDPDTFAKTTDFTDTLEFANNDKINVGNYLHPFFEMLNKFTKLTDLTLIGNNIKRIPSDAFNSLQNLTDLYISSDKIIDIGELPFYHLVNLQHFSLYVGVPFLTNSTLVFKETKTKLKITLALDKFIRGYRIEDNALARFNRPVVLDLSRLENQHYLDEHTIMPFLQAHPDNQVQFDQKLLDCSDCRNKWIQKLDNVNKRIVWDFNGVIKQQTCTNGKLVTDIDNFVSC